jgi:hypothetical protein
MCADKGHLDLKSKRIAELEKENAELRCSCREACSALFAAALKVKTLEADIIELKARIDHAASHGW